MADLRVLDQILIWFCNLKFPGLIFFVWDVFGYSEREFQRGDEIAWYADGDKIVRNEYNPATAYAFGNYLLNLNFIFVS
jgi:hypothetical protein